MTGTGREQFVSQALRPVPSTFDTARMARGEPGLPRCFVWGDRTLEVASVLRAWTQTGPCRHGSGEQYVRKHWYEVRTATGEVAVIYFERQPRPKSRTGERWWLFSLQGPPPAPPSPPSARAGSVSRVRPGVRAARRRDGPA